MRCDQLAEIARAHLSPDRWIFEVMAMPPAGKPGRQKLYAEDVSNAVVIFLKRAWKVLDADNLARWRDAARVFAIDYVDAPATALPNAPVDLHIAASGALETHLKQRERRAVVRVDHHSDPRLAPSQSFDMFRTGYFGRKGNVTLPQKLSRRVIQHDIPSGRVTGDILDNMANTAMHYAVREMPAAQDRDWFKPFTKGFNAAAVGAHVLVNSGVDDAVDWLGPDYPFLINNSDANSISSALDSAESVFGTPAWTEAQAPLRSMLDAVQHERIAEQLERALSVALS